MRWLFITGIALDVSGAVLVIRAILTSRPVDVARESMTVFGYSSVHMKVRADERRYAYVDVEYVGFSVLAWPALVAIALAGWAALAVPRGSAIAPVALVALAAMGLGIALLPSVLGAADERAFVRIASLPGWSGLLTRAG